MKCTGWQDVLAAKIEEWRARPLEYGSADCCQFAADVVRALTGVDYLGAFPAYQSLETADEIIATHGSVVGLVSSVLGEHKHPSRARRGEVVVYVDEKGRQVVGICIGVQLASIGPAGMAFRPMSGAIAAWDI